MNSPCFLFCEIDQRLVDAFPFTQPFIKLVAKNVERRTGKPWRTFFDEDMNPRNGVTFTDMGTVTARGFDGKEFQARKARIEFPERFLAGE